MKKTIKISMIIITLALLCSCTSGVKETSSVSSDFNIVPSSQEGISSEETLSDSLDKTAKIVDEKYVRRAADIINATDFTQYFPKCDLKYNVVAIDFNLLDLTDDKTPELIAVISNWDLSRERVPYCKTLIFDINNKELISEVIGDIRDFEKPNKNPRVLKSDNKYVSIHNFSEGSGNNNCIIYEIENIDHKLVTTPKFVYYTERINYDSKNIQTYVYENITKELSEKFYYNYFREEYEPYLEPYKTSSIYVINYLEALIPSEFISMTPIGFYENDCDNNKNTLIYRAEESYKYIENELKPIDVAKYMKSK
ncbi:MAG: hypothetical protein RSD67_07520 [Oscillospiraceae bacterium]